MTSGPAPTRLLERDREQRLLDDALAEPGRLVMIEGEPGVGKSELLRWAVRRATEMAMISVTAAGSEVGRPVAFGVASQLIAPVVLSLPEVEQDDLLEGAAAPARSLLKGPGGAAPLEFDFREATIQGLYWLTENLMAAPERGSTLRPALAAVDDAHWSDEASLLFLARLVARQPSLPLTILLALRPQESDVAGGTLEELRRHPGAVVLRPQPLSQPGAEAVVRSRFSDPDSGFVHACWRSSGGNPYYLGALLDELQSDGIAPDATSAAVVARLVPEDAARSILLRLGQLPEPAIELARAVAVLGSPTPLARAAALAGLEERVAEEAADQLARARLFEHGEPLSFLHPLIATSVHADQPSFARSRAHRRAAELSSEDRFTPVEAVAAHLLQCRPQADPWVVDTLREAGEQASASGEHNAALSFLTRALEEPPTSHQLTGVQRSLALATAAAGQIGSAEALDEAVLTIDDVSERAEVLLLLARLQIARGDFGAAAATADRALEGLPSDDPLSQPLLNALLMATSRYAPRRSEALRLFEPLSNAAKNGTFPDDATLCARLATRMASAGESPDLVRALASRALSGHPLVDPSGHGIPFAFVAAAIYWIDDFTTCMEMSDAAFAAAQEQGSPLAVMAASHWQAAATRQLGRLDEAVVHADRSFAVAVDGWNALVGWTGANLAITHLERGDPVAARAALERVEGTDRASLDWSFVLAARGQLALAEDRPDNAFELFEKAGRHLQDAYLIDHPGIAAWRSLAATAALRMGQVDRARQLASQELSLARGLGLPRVLGTSLLAAGIVEGGESGLEFFQEGVMVLRKSSASLVYAKALVEFGAALRRAGRRVEAREPLGQALHLATSFGADPLRLRAEVELRTAGGRYRDRQRARGPVRALAALTPTQHRVAHMAAQGLTNAQIAQDLYVTTKTVEWHLGHVYRELGVTGRRDLVRVLAQDPTSGLDPTDRGHPV